MASATEIAARTYAAAWNEPDPEERARMIDACFAPVEHRDGTADEFFDAGEVDASNRIAVLITFRGRMPTSS